MKRFFFALLSLLSLSVISFPKIVFAQNATPTDTSSAKQNAEKKNEEGKGDNKKRKATYIIYAGRNFNNLSVSSDQFESMSDVGYHIGFSYRSNGFLYWQAGLRFNAPAYELKPVLGFTDSMDNKFSVSSIDVPITGGINFLSVTNRVFNVRAFISVVPAFALSVSSNDLSITKDAINTFNFYGQGGVGFDVLFLVVEGGYNYGFSDLLKGGKSNPGQVFVNVGFRF